MALTQVDGGLLSPTNGQFYSMKNRIINGQMVLDQRNAGASVTPGSGAYTLDRWQALQSTASKFSVQQTPSATETGYATRVAAGFSNYLGVTSLSAYPVSSSDYYAIRQSVEGLNTSDFAWGTASAKSITISALVYSSLTGTFGGSIQNNANNYNYPFSYSIPVANTWTQISITIAGPTSGTWLTTNGTGLIVNFGLGVGTTFSGIAGAWSATNVFSATGATSVVGTNGATFYITGVQLEKGSTATSFDYRPYGTELMLCQRYYFKSGGINGLVFNANYASAQFKVTMRATPTVTVTPASGVTSAISPDADGFFATNTTVSSASYTAYIEL